MNTLTSYEGWVPENCPKVGDDWYFNVSFHDVPGGWAGRAICGTKIFYAFDGTKRILRKTNDERQLLLKF